MPPWCEPGWSPRIAPIARQMESQGRHSGQAEHSLRHEPRHGHCAVRARWPFDRLDLHGRSRYVQVSVLGPPPELLVVVQPAIACEQTVVEYRRQGDRSAGYSSIGVSLQAQNDRSKSNIVLNSALATSCANCPCTGPGCFSYWTKLCYDVRMSPCQGKSSAGVRSIKGVESMDRDTKRSKAIHVWYSNQLERLADRLIDESYESPEIALRPVCLRCLRSSCRTAISRPI